MSSEYIIYKRFNDPALANELTEQLDQHNIEFYLEENSSGFDPSMVMSNSPVDYVVKIRRSDFQKVNQLLLDEEKKNIDIVDKEHYLFNFTNDELKEVIFKADEWNAFDVLLARKILGERGVAISDNEIAAINSQRAQELRKPDESQIIWIYIGYFFAFMGGILGVFIGWHLMNHKKTLSDGEQIYDYTESDRRHGKRMFYISIICIPIWITIKIIARDNNGY